MKTLFLSIPVGVNVRNILRSDALPTLLEAGVRVVCFTPGAEDPELRAELAHPRLVFRPLPRYRPSPTVKRLRRLERFAFFTTRDIATFDIKHRRGPVRRRLLRPLARLVLNDRVQERLRALKLRRVDHAAVDADFAEYRPDLLFCTCPHILEELPLIAAARAREVPIVAMVQSWDNLSSKGTFPIRFDQVVVWSEVLREEVERLYGYAPEEVAVTGIPQFDRYADKTRLAAREDFFQEIGADPARKLIVYTCGTEKISPREPELVGLLAEAIGRGAVRPAAQLLVRPHYRDNPARYAAVRRLPHVLFRPPGRFSRVVERFWNPDESDLDHFCNLLHHADVVVNVASTVTIDAAPFDTPVVNVAFDGAAPRPYYQSTRRYYDYSHYRRIVASGGVRLAHGAEELVAHVNAYLADPALDREGRARIVAEQCYRVDGESGRRIGRVLLQRLEATASARPAAALG